MAAWASESAAAEAEAARLRELLEQRDRAIAALRLRAEARRLPGFVPRVRCVLTACSGR